MQQQTINVDLFISAIIEQRDAANTTSAQFIAIANERGQLLHEANKKIEELEKKIAELTADVVVAPDASE